jgi:hypothetical protein
MATLAEERYPELEELAARAMAMAFDVDAKSFKSCPPDLDEVCEGWDRLIKMGKVASARILESYLDLLA